MQTYLYLVDAWQLANAIAAMKVLGIECHEYVKVVDKNPNGIAHNYKVLLKFERSGLVLEETELLTLYGEVTQPCDDRLMQPEQSAVAPAKSV